MSFPNQSFVPLGACVIIVVPPQINHPDCLFPITVSITPSENATLWNAKNTFISKFFTSSIMISSAVSTSNPSL